MQAASGAPYVTGLPVEQEKYITRSHVKEWTRRVKGVKRKITKGRTHGVQENRSCINICGSNEWSNEPTKPKGPSMRRTDNRKLTSNNEC